jgi:hypothetical protein
MVAFLYYPFYLLIFWYRDVLGSLFEFFTAFNRYVASLLSIPLLLKTFFKPLKNEYREGLVVFSVISGIAVKSVLISVNLLIIFIILLIEFFIGLFLLALPVLLILLFFISKKIL